MKKLRHLDESAHREVERSFHRVVNKVLHAPVMSLREEADHGAPYGLLEALKRLFHLRD